MADDPLNPWWGLRFGFETIEEFEDATDEYFGNLFVYDPTGALKSLAQRDAAVFPGSAPGILAAGYLSAQGAAGSSSWEPVQAVIETIGSASHQPSGNESSMSQLIIPDCFQVAILATSGGQQVDNVVGVRNAGGTAAGAAAAVQAAWKVTSGPLSGLIAGYTLVGFRAVDIGDPNGDIAVVSDTATGGGAGSISTNAACALIKWNGGQRSRSSRGRLYYGPQSEANINPDGRTLATGAVTSFNTFFTNFRNSLNASGYPLVVLSRVLSEAFPVTQSACESVIATQRRRIRS